MMKISKIAQDWISIYPHISTNFGFEKPSNPIMKNLISIHIKVLSGYYLLFAFLIAGGGVIYLVASDWLLRVIPENDYFLQMTQSDFLLWGGILLIVAGLEAWLAIALLKSSKVARVIAIAISVLGLIWAIFGLIAYTELLNLFFLIIHSYFLWVLFYKYHRLSTT